jgi:cell division protein FtsB
MIKQFTINLNKGEGEVVLRLRKQERRSYFLLVLFGLVFIVLGALTWSQNQQMNDVVNSRQQKLDRIKFELDSLKREATKVSKDDVLALASLEQDRFLWSRRLEKLSEILPQGMAITGIEFQNKTLKLHALAQVDTNVKEFEVISKFIELLKTTPEFREGLFEIRFDQSLRKVIEDQDVLVFSVDCLTQDPDRKATKVVAKTKVNSKSGVDF